MLNQTVLVGRVATLPTEYICSEGKFYIMSIVVPRVGSSSKDDTFNVLLTENIADNTAKYCAVKDIIGVKGSLRVFDNTLYVLGEKITFLTSTHTEGGE